MNQRRRYLEDQLQSKESGTLYSHRNFHELRAKFFQLEQAFEMNLQLQSRIEVELNRIKLENQDLRNINDKVLRTKTELNSKLIKAIIEKDHWRNAFIQQKESIESNEIKCNDAVAEAKRKWEDILKTTQETAEKRYQEIVELYNGVTEKVIHLEEEIETYKCSRREHENRTFELANLLETLKRFDLNVSSICQAVAQVLKNLTERGNLYEESMKNLRHLAWTAEDKKDEPELVLLREQNFVLKEVVKSLKWKILQQANNEAAESKIERHTTTFHKIETNCKKNSPNQPTSKIYCPLNTEIATNSLIKESNHNFNEYNKEHNGSIIHGVTGTRGGNNNRHTEFDIDSGTIDSRGKTLCIESHSNGRLYNEYVVKLSNNHEIKIKYPVSLKNNQTAVRIEFVDDESEYEKELSDRMLILFKNIYASVEVKQTGIPCSTQTTKNKITNNFTQTTITGTNSFSRLNVGATMLNSEKRAIERSLCNLERTVKTLKVNALNQAQTMIGNSSQFCYNSEMFDYMQILTQ